MNAMLKKKKKMGDGFLFVLVRAMEGSKRPVVPTDVMIPKAYMYIY